MNDLDELIKSSKEAIGEVSPNLKESIINEFDERQHKRSGGHLKLKKILLPIMSILIVVSIALVTVIKGTKEYTTVSLHCLKGETSDSYYSSSGSTSYSERSSSIFYSISGDESESKTVDDDEYYEGEPIYIDGKMEKIIDRSSIDSIYDYMDSSLKDSSEIGSDLDIFIEDEDTEIYAGKLTSSAVNDNEEYDFFKNLLVKGQDDEGEFYQYEKYGFNLKNRIKVTVDKGLSGKVSLVRDGEIIYESVIDRSGNAYLFNDSNEECNLIIEGKDYKYVFSDVNSDLDLTGKTEELKNEHEDVIELMFVIDATGSMGDEIDYLKAEIKDVINKVKKENANSKIYLAIMMYRDEGDDYITKYSDFTTDIDSQQEFLKNQVASGGGDFEEAVTIALTEAIDKKWSDSDSTKIIVHVADAPAHDEDIDKLVSINKELSKKGIRVITVASSGIDKKTEYFMRAESIMTGGVYGYLTDDSGIGGSHVEATTEEKEVVEYLNSMLVRLINGIHKGEFENPVPYTQEVK